MSRLYVNLVRAVLNFWFITDRQIGWSLGKVYVFTSASSCSNTDVTIKLSLFRTRLANTYYENRRSDKAS